MGVSDPQQLGTVERYFLEIMDIPRLQQRIDKGNASGASPSTTAQLSSWGEV